MLPVKHRKNHPKTNIEEKESNVKSITWIKFRFYPHTYPKSAYTTPDIPPKSGPEMKYCVRLEAAATTRTKLIKCFCPFVSFDFTPKIEKPKHVK